MRNKPERRIEELSDQTIGDAIMKMLDGPTLKEVRQQRFIDKRQNRKKNHAR